MSKAPRSAPRDRGDGLLPLEFVDAHHHFLDTASNPFQSFLASLNGNDAVYLPNDYQRDVVQPLRDAGVELVASIHVECLPDDGRHEAAWVESLGMTHNNDKENDSHGTTVAAIVASCDLASPNVLQELQALHGQCKLVEGIRWILDYAGLFSTSPTDDNDNATHVATTRHVKGMEDYLRDGPNGSVLPAFEHGFGLLEQFGYSFDLQCAPEQLLAAAGLFARHPNIPVVIDHWAKPRKICVRDVNDSATTIITDWQQVEQWRRGLEAMAALPNVYVKISMLGYAFPDWSAGDARQEALLIQWIQETVDLFGAGRCMVALNWWKDAAMSDSDGIGSVGPTSLQLVRFLATKCFAKYSTEERDMLFAGTAKRFYRLEKRATS